MEQREHKKEEKNVRSPQGRDNASFLNNAADNAAKTKSNLVQQPSITLPKGGGAMKSIDEKFSVNAVNGTAAYSIPLPFSPGRNNFTPSLSLNYNSGAGNSPFGIGWSADYPCIQRKTEKKLPTYNDVGESDTFIFSGAEDLVPHLLHSKDGLGNDVWTKDTHKEGAILITRYCPRIESGFARIEKLEDGNNVYWRVRSRENIVSVFGKSDKAQIVSPIAGEKNKIFRWCLEFSYDDKGNYTRYKYKKENLDNVEPALQEKNRFNKTPPFTNIYLKSIQYGNEHAYYEGDPEPTIFLFELLFDYGEHAASKPLTTETNTWLCRMDPFSDYRAGFEIRTYRLCRRILMFHHFPAELGQQDYLVRSMELDYDEQKHLTYLERITQTGYIWKTDGNLQSKKSLPPLDFSYVKPGFSREVKEITPDNTVHDPVGLDNQLYQWTDFYSEGIAGILTEQANGWFYKQNLGDGNFTKASCISPKPNFTGLANGSLSLLELAADGKKYIVQQDTFPKGYFELTLEEEWKGWRPFDTYPNIDFKDPNLKYIDLNGDGLPDLLISKQQDFVWYGAKGTAGYDDPITCHKAIEEEKGPQVIFADPDERILVAIADMSGDGLADIVVISYAAVCYYPNLGYGRFGAKVTLSMEGCFDSATDFMPHQVYLADIDGSGTTDIIYAAKDKIAVWFNQSGNCLQPPSTFFYTFPQRNSQTKLSFVDLTGNGTLCMVWSSPLPQQQGAPLRYIDLMGGKKPHILVGYKNNRGKEVSLEYKSSVNYYLADKQRGDKWITKLPFPVQCVSKVITQDKVAQTRFTNEYSYHHGYYDTAEREFRGFAMVIQSDTESFETFVRQTAAGITQTVEQDFFQPVVITKSWFHTGAYINGNTLFDRLRETWYPNALIKQGVISDPAMITALGKYNLPETTLPAKLTATESVECCRALKGLLLRQEIYSDEGDDSVRQHPYSVTAYNYDLQLLQPKAIQQHAVFISHEKENLAIHYERNPADPRLSHSMNIEIDPFGNVLQSAAIVYGRLQDDGTLPTISDRQQQAKQQVIYTTNRFTKAIDQKEAYLLPVACESQSWELNAPPAVNTIFTVEDIRNQFSSAAEKKYEEQALENEKREIEHSRTLFLQHDLTGPAPLGTTEIPLLPFQNYLLAFTPSMIADIYAGKTDDAFLRGKGRYVQLDGDGQYWIKSGRTYFHPDLTAHPVAKTVPPPTPADVAFARANFYLPVVTEDNFGFLTQVFYDPHKLFIRRCIDAKENETTVEAFNYRVQAPVRLKDANNNETGVRFDETGVVIASFIMGKSGEFRGDYMDTASTEASAKDHPGSTMDYTFRYFATNGLLPDRVKTTVREQHHYLPKAPESGGVVNWLKHLSDSPDTSNPGIAAGIISQESYAYSDGSGHVVQVKVQAEPGLAPLRDSSGILVRKPNGELETAADTAPAIRWVGNGRTIVNNKGNAVKQYQPYFDSTPEYNTEKELTEMGFTTLIHYDSLGRVIKTDYPIGTFSSVVFDAWMQQASDENDNVVASRWYNERIAGKLGPAEQQTAQHTALHNATPVTSWFDSLGRPFLVRSHHKSQRTGEAVEEHFYYTRTDLDIEGNPKSITDAKGHTVMQWKYDMLGNICYQKSMDAGERWMLSDTMGKPLRLWDSRGQTFTYEYDQLHRPLQHLMDDGASELVFEKFAYGEGIKHDRVLNMRGKLYQHFDTAGLLQNEVFDFKGNLLRSSRTLLKDYTRQPDWTTKPALEATAYASETLYDALNRPIRSVAPDKSIVLPTYNEANLLESLKVQLKGASTLTTFVRDINYNEKGQRQSILYGNNTLTTYTYQEENSRLLKLTTMAAGGTRILQDLQYVYDPVGNITLQTDNAQKTVFYGGQKVNAESEYLYDSLYRLVQASGREHIGQVGLNANDNWNDHWSKISLQPNAANQLRGYTQKYAYDGVGNIDMMRHSAGGYGWTRTYFYDKANNQLTRTKVDGQVYHYTYNAHGSMETVPHLNQQIDWNGMEEMQHLHLGGGGEAWYVYDGNGQRVRKVIERSGNRREERIYIGGFEVYREYTGNTVTLERETLHIMDDKRRVAMVETKTGEAALIRYQYSDHLGSAALELDELARIISYEEYYPYGTTAYQATDSTKQVPAKRYRYTGMERDEETGLNYHSARYYLPWLGRWMSTDPLGLYDSNNLYNYVMANPIVRLDTNGRSLKEVTANATNYVKEVIAIAQDKKAVEKNIQDQTESFNNAVSKYNASGKKDMAALDQMESARKSLEFQKKSLEQLNQRATKLNTGTHPHSAKSSPPVTRGEELAAELHTELGLHQAESTIDGLKEAEKTIANVEKANSQLGQVTEDLPKALDAVEKAINHAGNLTRIPPSGPKGGGGGGTGTGGTGAGGEASAAQDAAKAAGKAEQEAGKVVEKAATTRVLGRFAKKAIPILGTVYGAYLVEQDLKEKKYGRAALDFAQAVPGYGEYVIAAEQGVNLTLWGVNKWSNFVGSISVSTNQQVRDIGK